MNTKMRVVGLIAGGDPSRRACSSGRRRRLPRGGPFSCCTDAAGTRRPAAPVGRGGPDRLPDHLAVLRVGRRTEATALKQVTDAIKAANPGLDLDVRTSRSTTSSRSSRSRPPAAAVPTCSSPRTTASARRPARACSSTSVDAEGKLTNDVGLFRSTAARSTARCTWFPSRSRPSPCSTTSRKLATPPATTDALLAGVKHGIDQGRLRRRQRLPLVRLVGRLRRSADGRHRQCIADTTGVADAYKWLQDLQAAGATWYDKYDDLASDFQSGKIDLIIDGPWASGGYKEALGDNLGVARCPPVQGPSQPMTASTACTSTPTSQTLSWRSTSPSRW